MAYYVDTSALVKLVVAVAETDALRNWMVGEGLDFVASDLARTELTRAVRGAVPDRMLLAHQVLDSLTLIAVTSQVCTAAGRFDPAELRSLDAIHLASALEVGDDIEGVVSYDERFAAAANAHGVVVAAPQ